MINRESILLRLIEEFIQDTDLYLVSCDINKENRISIEIDSFDGVPIETCTELSRKINEGLDREEMDFELEVASATLGHPFKVFQQYLKYIDKAVAVTLKNGVKEEGMLREATPEEIILEVIRKVKPENKKRKVEVKEALKILMEDIKETKAQIQFK